MVGKLFKLYTVFKYTHCEQTLQVGIIQMSETAFLGGLGACLRNFEMYITVESLSEVPFYAFWGQNSKGYRTSFLRYVSAMAEFF